MNEWEFASTEEDVMGKWAEDETLRQAMIDAAPRMLEALGLVLDGGWDYTNSDGDHILVCLSGKEINVSELVRTARGGA